MALPQLHVATLPMQQFEDYARANKIGLWSDPEPNSTVGLAGRGETVRRGREARLKAHKPQYAPDACLIVYR